jgi:hypothetical protein
MSQNAKPPATRFPMSAELYVAYCNYVHDTFASHHHIPTPAIGYFNRTPTGIEVCIRVQQDHQLVRDGWIEFIMDNLTRKPVCGRGVWVYYNQDNNLTYISPLHHKVWTTYKNHDLWAKKITSTYPSLVLLTTNQAVFKGRETFNLG